MKMGKWVGRRWVKERTRKPSFDESTNARNVRKHILWGKNVKRRRVEGAQFFGGSEMEKL
jgi:hypothetical protein